MAYYPNYTVPSKSNDQKIARALRLAPSRFPSPFVSPQCAGDRSQSRPTRGHSRARLSPLALWSAALWPLPRNANKIFGAAVLRTAALDPIGH